MSNQYKMKRLHKNLLFTLIGFVYSNNLWSQVDTLAVDRIRYPSNPYVFTERDPSSFAISGTIGITYEHYGLITDPANYPVAPQRRPWNQVRFNIQPTLNFGKDFSIPLNFSFPLFATSFAGPYMGIKKPTLGQFLVNPANNFGISPKYKWAQLLLGTQYLKYSELSTGDIGIFGFGFDLRPKGYLIKFFTGTSQQGIDYVATPLPGTTGAFKRTHYMFQLGKEKEKKYLFAVNFSEGKDHINSVTTPPLTIKPQEGFVMSLIAEVYAKKGWYVKSEVARSYFTKDITQPVSPLSDLSFKPFIDGKTSTQTDYAGNVSVGRKTKDFDIGYTTKYIGGGFQTIGYPYMAPDHWDNTLNTRFNAWKRKMNVVASFGVRTNNISNASLTSQVLIGNLNWLTQFNEHVSLNLSYNNFGFSAPSGTNPYAVKNVSNDFGISPTFTFTNAVMMHLIICSYNYSKYDERDVMTGITTSNNTNTVLLSYNPVFFKNELTPELSVLYFNNSMPLVKNTLLTFTAGVGTPAFKKHVKIRAQVQYTRGKLNSFTANNNLSPSINIDWKIIKKLTWTNFFSYNHFQYGNELAPPAFLDGAGYQEFFLRTGLQYKF